MIGARGANVGDKRTVYRCVRCDTEWWKQKCSELCSNCGIDLRVSPPVPHEQVMTETKPHGKHWWQDPEYAWRDVA